MIQKTNPDSVVSMFGKRVEKKSDTSKDFVLLIKLNESENLIQFSSYFSRNKFKKPFICAVKNC